MFFSFSVMASHPLPEGTESNPYRHRLIRYYKLYNRDKLPVVEEALTSCWGTWHELMAQLVTRYGPEPPPEDFRPRLERMYKTYEPEKLPNVKKVLELFAGFEEEMFCVLVSKYGLEPDPPTPRGYGNKTQSDWDLNLNIMLHKGSTRMTYKEEVVSTMASQRYDTRMWNEVVQNTGGFDRGTSEIAFPGPPPYHYPPSAPPPPPPPSPPPVPQDIFHSMKTSPLMKREVQTEQVSARSFEQWTDIIAPVHRGVKQSLASSWTPPTATVYHTQGEGVRPEGVVQPAPGPRARVGRTPSLPAPSASAAPRELPGPRPYVWIAAKIPLGSRYLLGIVRELDDI